MIITSEYEIPRVVKKITTEMKFSVSFFYFKAWLAKWPSACLVFESDWTPD